ncbi:sulfurtransferase complex subunit TusD [Paraferrimonas haliotis]|uniref:Sulfurtransferase TusD n=1 Tax=Paraferrimonas haliotis TaxID=2013866 RepID=A0AA37TRS1_9GAMM|nr:sulfurtransferase complex subunit TusD [Paraferrimonas haliotis]GLS84533.1 sulfurtransferase TusD [Paraferrimonas haliotis]
MTRFTILVNHPPYGSEHAYSALRFCEAALKQGHEITQVFFYLDGVYNTTALLSPQSDELHLVNRWKHMAHSHSIPLISCVSAGLRRGVVNQVDASDNELESHNMDPAFVAAGLGELVAAIEDSDRLVQF